MSAAGQSRHRVGKRRRDRTRRPDGIAVGSNLRLSAVHEEFSAIDETGIIGGQEQNRLYWLVSPDGQQAIGAYQVNGEKLFNPSAGSPQ
jgi:hypothetical protein